MWQDFSALVHMPLNALGVKDQDPVRDVGEKRYRWQNDLSYQGEQFDGCVNVLDVLKRGPDGRYTRCRGYVSNLRLSRERVEEVEGWAQQRWKIENQGFDAQKQHGYGLEHVWCRHAEAMKVVYLLIQIAHLLNQLVIKADVLGVAQELGSKKRYLKVFERALTQAWSSSLETAWGYLSQCQFQLRWQT